MSLEHLCAEPVLAAGLPRMCLRPTHPGPDHQTRIGGQWWPWTNCACLCHTQHSNTHLPNCNHEGADDGTDQRPPTL